MNLERETGIEPATNSLEGCDSTIELLPPTRTHDSPSTRPSASLRALDLAVTRPVTSEPRSGVSSDGEGRIRTFEGARPTDLQSAAFDRFATSPELP